MVIARKIAYNVLVSSLSKFLSTAIALVVIGFITRYLGKEGFGEYATVLAFLAFFSAISDFGLYQFSTREISRAGADVEKIMGNVFTMRIVFSLVVLLFAFVLSFFLPYTREINFGVVIVAASFVFSSGYQVLNGVFQKNLAMDRVAISELIGKFLQLAIVAGAVYWNMGFYWIIASLLFNMIFSFTLVYLWSRKYFRLHWSFDFIYWRKFLRGSYSIGITAIIVFVYFKMDTLLISYLKGSADVGVYNVAYKVLENIIFFPAMIVGLVFPIISQTIHTDKAKFKEMTNKTLKVFTLIVIPLVIGTLFLADGVIGVIGGSAFAESALVLRILVFALAGVFFGSLFNAVLIAGNLQKKLMFILLFAAVFNLVLNLIFIPLYSYLAAACISVATELLVASATYIFIVRELGYVPKIEKIGGMLLSGIAMGSFLFIFPNLNFILSGLLSVVIYGAALWLFRAVEIAEITSIISKKGLVENNGAITEG